MTEPTKANASNSNKSAFTCNNGDKGGDVAVEICHHEAVELLNHQCGGETSEGVCNEAKNRGRSWLAKLCRENAFMLATLAGVLVGFLIGLAIRVAHAERQISVELNLWLGMPGEIFIRLLKLTILPQIAANVVVVASSLDPKQNGKISLVSFTYVILANIVGSIIGCVVALIINPGINRGPMTTSNGTATVENIKFDKLTSSDVFADLLLNIFPDNIIGVALYKVQTVYKTPLKGQLIQLGVLEGTNVTVVLNERQVTNSESANLIGIIFCAAAFGMAARMLGDKGRPFIDFFESLAQVVMKIMRWFLWMTPPGVCFMIAVSVANVIDGAATMMKLGLFVLSVTVGLAIHFVLLQIVFIVASRRNPFPFMVKTLRSWCIAFATTAPAVAIPEMIECCDIYGIAKDISRFVIPFASVTDGDSSACFIAVAAIFIAQLTGFPITFGTIVVIVLLVSSAMLALPNTPSASLVILVTILTSIGISETEVALLYSIDWLLDRMRSGSNCLSQCYCAAVTDAICFGSLRASDEPSVVAKPNCDSQAQQENELPLSVIIQQ